MNTPSVTVSGCTFNDNGGWGIDSVSIPGLAINGGDLNHNTKGSNLARFRRLSKPEAQAKEPTKMSHARPLAVSLPIRARSKA